MNWCPEPQRLSAHLFAFSIRACVSMWIDDLVTTSWTEPETADVVDYLFQHRSEISGGIFSNETYVDLVVHLARKYPDRVRTCDTVEDKFRTLQDTVTIIDRYNSMLGTGGGHDPSAIFVGVAEEAAFDRFVTDAKGLTHSVLTTYRNCPFPHYEKLRTMPIISSYGNVGPECLSKVGSTAPSHPATAQLPIPPSIFPQHPVAFHASGSDRADGVTQETVQRFISDLPFGASQILSSKDPTISDDCSSLHHSVGTISLALVGLTAAMKRLTQVLQAAETSVAMHAPQTIATAAYLTQMEKIRLYTYFSERPIEAASLPTMDPALRKILFRTVLEMTQSRVLGWDNENDYLCLFSTPCSS